MHKRASLITYLVIMVCSWPTVALSKTPAANHVKKQPQQQTVPVYKSLRERVKEKCTVYRQQLKKYKCRIVTTVIAMLWYATIRAEYDKIRLSEYHEAYALSHPLQIGHRHRNMHANNCESCGKPLTNKNSLKRFKCGYAQCLGINCWSSNMKGVCPCKGCPAMPVEEHCASCHELLTKNNGSQSFTCNHKQCLNQQCWPSNATGNCPRCHNPPVDVLVQCTNAHKCSICQDDTDPLTKINAQLFTCTHSLHKTCWQQRVDSCGDNRCIICRVGIPVATTTNTHKNQEIISDQRYAASATLRLTAAILRSI